MSGNSSVFSPFYIDFVQHNSQQQASMILDEVAALQKQGYEQVGITYSANHDQTMTIEETYQKGLWKTGTSGANQAQVITDIEFLLETDKYKALQQVFRIIPISTCAHSGGAGAVKEEWLDKELSDIQSFLKKPARVVLGWQNQLSGTANFAVGGGISLALTPEQNTKIQNFLKSCLKDYPKPPTGPKGNNTPNSSSSPNKKNTGASSPPLSPKGNAGQKAQAKTEPTPTADDLTFATFKQNHAMSLNHSGFFRAIKKFFSTMRDLLFTKKSITTMAAVINYAKNYPTTRTAHILRMMNSTMTAQEFKQAYEAARQKQWFHNPFETTMQDKLKALNTPADLDMGWVRNHAMNRPDSLTAEIICSHSKKP